MAEAGLAARGAFAESLPAGRLGRLSGPPGVFAREVEVAGAAALLGAAGDAGSLAEPLRALGIDLPPPRRWTAGGTAGEGWQALSVGPDRWLVLGPPDAARRLSEQVGAGCVVDQSDARAVLSLRGPAVREVLSRILAIDLHPRAFRPGDVAVTLAGHLGCVLWQLDEAPEYRLAVARSYAASLARWLLETATAFGLVVEG